MELSGYVALSAGTKQDYRYGQIRTDTELKNFPLYCPKCRQESLIDVKDLQVTVIKRLEAKYKTD